MVFSLFKAVNSHSLLSYKVSFMRSYFLSLLILSQLKCVVIVLFQNIPYISHNALATPFKHDLCG